ncbi:unnamed protein product [Blepharisma stoltei]|uniref:Uncharacterized protein n=1 Tax=Blepharisma stoltei TaxID=1481888 RepID=A0AAU9JEH8_9CILI|nr:unnamed protein product [Blepharisma stoltei]
MWINKYIDCLEDKLQLESLIQVELLNKIDSNLNINETFFQTYTGGIVLMSLEQALRPKYKLHIGTANNFGEKTDGIFIPNPGESSTIIIHEFKILHVANYKEVLERANDALWQIYSKKYMDIAFRFKHSHFRSVIIRGIVLYKCSSTRKLTVFIKEHQFSYCDAEEIDNHFSTASGGILPLSSILSRDNSRMDLTEKARDKLGGNNIDELIEKIINKDPSLANIDKTYEEETLKRKINPGAEGKKLLRVSYNF